VTRNNKLDLALRQLAHKRVQSRRGRIVDVGDCSRIDHEATHPVRSLIDPACADLAREVV
jgi:hypothetical protein